MKCCSSRRFVERAARENVININKVGELNMQDYLEELLEVTFDEADEEIGEDYAEV